MKIKSVLWLLLIFSIFLVGCNLDNPVIGTKNEELVTPSASVSKDSLNFGN